MFFKNNNRRGNYANNKEDLLWNKGNGWQAIGFSQKPFQAILEGNGHTIHNLFQDQSDAAVFVNQLSGLFEAVGNRGQVVGLGLEGVEIKGVNWVGAVAGFSQGNIVDCSTRGQVAGVNSVGGLVGHNFGDIFRSHVQVEVKGVLGAGALVGWNVGGLIEESSAPGQEAGSLVGLGTPAR